jgi:hypothetical protein
LFKVIIKAHARSVSRLPSRFASVEEMFSVRQKVDCVLWVAELKSYSHLRHKFNQVCQKQTAPFCRSVMRRDKHLKETGSFMQQYGPPRRAVSQYNAA